jgi:hypothetical protein
VETPQKPVACQCPDGFVLDVLDTLPGNIRMRACIKCGRTDLADSIVTEDSPHDVQFHGYFMCELADDAKAWASAWPRYKIVDKRRVYLAGMARSETIAELEAALAAAAAAQRASPLRDTLLTLGVPENAPPASLPESLAGFVEIWNGLQFTDDTPVEALLDAATRFNGPHELAADVLARRTDLADLATIMLFDPDGERRTWGRYLVEQFGVVSPAILDAIRLWLGMLSDNQSGEMYAIRALLRHMGAAALPLLPDIKAAAQRAKDCDYYMHKDFTELMLFLTERPSSVWDVPRVAR